MVSWFAVNSEVVFLMSLPSSDWYPELPGAKHYGRVLSPREYDGKKLGSYFPQLTPGRSEVNAPAVFMIALVALPYPAQRRMLQAVRPFCDPPARLACATQQGYTQGPRLKA